MFSLTHAIGLPSDRTGLALRAALVNAAGVIHSFHRDIATGFFEFGGGQYQWTYNNYPDGYRGSAVFYTGTLGVAANFAGVTFQGFVDINPPSSNSIFDGFDDFSLILDESLGVSSGTDGYMTAWAEQSGQGNNPTISSPPRVDPDTGGVIFEQNYPSVAGQWLALSAGFVINRRDFTILIVNEPHEIMPGNAEGATATIIGGTGDGFLLYLVGSGGAVGHLALFDGVATTYFAPTFTRPNSVIVISGDASGVRAFGDEQYWTGGPLAAGTVVGGHIGNTASSHFPYRGRMQVLGHRAVASSVAQMATLRDRCYRRFGKVPPRVSVVVAGDSISLGTDVNTINPKNACWPTMVVRRPDEKLWNYSQVGKPAWGAAGDALNFGPKAFMPGALNICILFVGTNDLASAISPVDAAASIDLAASRYMTAGYRVIKIPPLPRSGVSEANRQSLKTLMLAQTTHVAVVELPPELDAPTAHADTRYFLDGTHINTQGERLLAVAVERPYRAQVDSINQEAYGAAVALVSHTGIAQAGSGGTITLSPAASSVDNFYRGAVIRLRSGAGAGQSAIIQSYVGATRIVAISGLSGWAVVPDTTTVYDVLAMAGNSRQDVRDAMATGRSLTQIVNSNSPDKWSNDAAVASLSVDGKLTAPRAALIDNLNVGTVASQADINALNQSASRRIIVTAVDQFERPEAGNTVYTVEGRTYDGDGAAVNADVVPTLTATGSITGNLSGNLSAAANPATGVYRWSYTVASAAAIEQIRFDISATMTTVFTLSKYSQVADFVAATWTTADRDRLSRLDTDLPTARVAKIDFLDASIQSRMATFAYTAPDNANIGTLATLWTAANRDKLVRLDTDLSTARVSKIDLLDSLVGRIPDNDISTMADRFLLMTRPTGAGDFQFDAPALALAPTGTGGGGGGGGGIAGPNVVRLRFFDYNGVPVASEPFTVSGVGSAIANPSGEAVVGLNTGVQIVIPGPVSGLIWAPTEIDVPAMGGTETTFDITADQQIIPPAVDPAYTRCYTTVRDARGAVVPSGTMEFQVTDPPAGSDSWELAPFTVTADFNGLLTVDLPANSVCQGRRGSGEWVQIAVGSGPTQPLPEIVETANV